MCAPPETSPPSGALTLDAVTAWLCVTVAVGCGCADTAVDDDSTATYTWPPHTSAPDGCTRRRHTCPRPQPQRNGAPTQRESIGELARLMKLLRRQPKAPILTSWRPSTTESARHVGGCSATAMSLTPNLLTPRVLGLGGHIRSCFCAHSSDFGVGLSRGVVSALSATRETLRRS